MNLDRFLDHYATSVGLILSAGSALAIPAAAFVPLIPWSAGTLFLVCPGVLIGLGLILAASDRRTERFEGRLEEWFGHYQSEQTEALKSALSDAKSLRDDTVQSLRSEASKITDVNGEAVEKFKRAAEIFDRKHQELDKLISQLEDRMISEKQWRLIRRIVAHYQNGSYETMADAVGELSRSVGEVTLPDDTT